MSLQSPLLLAPRKNPVNYGLRFSFYFLFYATSSIHYCMHFKSLYYSIFTITMLWTIDIAIIRFWSILVLWCRGWHSELLLSTYLGQKCCQVIPCTYQAKCFKYTKLILLTLYDISSLYVFTVECLILCYTALIF